MKTTKHVEHLLRQGRKPKELIELGFPKQVVTRIRRRLRKEKASAQGKVPKSTSQAESSLLTVVESPEKIASIERKLQSMTDDIQKLDSLLKTLPEVITLMAIAENNGIYRYETCPHQKDGLCTFQTWSNQDEIPKGIGELVFVEEKKPQWYIKPSPLYCAMCTIPFENHLDEIEDKLSDDPLSQARSQITCKSCGSNGWIAVRIKCTKCGRETYLGWWPEKE